MRGGPSADFPGPWPDSDRGDLTRELYSLLGPVTRVRREEAAPLAREFGSFIPRNRWVQSTVRDFDLKFPLFVQSTHPYEIQSSSNVSLRPGASFSPPPYPGRPREGHRSRRREAPAGTDAAGADLLDMVYAGGWARIPLGLLRSGAPWCSQCSTYRGPPQTNFIDDEVIEKSDAAVSQMAIAKANQSAREKPRTGYEHLHHGPRPDQSRQSLRRRWKRPSRSRREGLPRPMCRNTAIHRRLARWSACWERSPRYGARPSTRSRPKVWASRSYLADNIAEALHIHREWMTICDPRLFFFFFSAQVKA